MARLDGRYGPSSATVLRRLKLLCLAETALIVGLLIGRWLS